MSDLPIWMPAADAIANGCLTGLNVSGVMRDALEEIASLQARLDAARAIAKKNFNTVASMNAVLAHILRALDGAP